MERRSAGRALASGIGEESILEGTGDILEYSLGHPLAQVISLVPSWRNTYGFGTRLRIFVEDNTSMVQITVNSQPKKSPL